MNPKINKLLQYNNQLRELVETVFDRKFYFITPKQAFLAYSFAKAYKTHASIIVLCQKGNGQDAAILTRSLFELAVTTLYVLKDKTGSRLQRWLDFDWVIRDEIYKHVQSEPGVSAAFDARAQNPREGDSSVEEVSKMAQKMRKKYHYDLRKGWSDKIIKQMSEAVGLESIYMTAYRLMSDLHHSAVRTMNDYFSQGANGEIMADTAPSERWIQETLVSSFQFFIMIIDKWTDEFNLGLDDKLQKLSDDYVNNVRGLNVEAEQT